MKFCLEEYKQFKKIQNGGDFMGYVMEKKSEEVKTADVSVTFIEVYYEHQYDRINKLEERQLTITNIAIGFSIVAFTFGFNNQIMNLATGIALPLLVILFNIFAIIFINNCEIFIDLHQKRAAKAMELYANDIYKLNSSLPSPNLHGLSDRKTIQVYIHLLVIIAGVIPIFLFIQNLLK